MKKFLINDFEGPLDLLLHLIKQSKMDIYDIKIVEITEQYVEFIKEMEEMNLDIASEYLVMAAELIEMKSKYLLPSLNEEESNYEQDNTEELTRRLIEYKKYKESTSKFKALEEKRKVFYTKSSEDLNKIIDKPLTNNGDVGLDDLISAIQRILERQEYSKPRITKKTNKELSVKERVIKIRSILKEKKKVSFESLFEVIDKQTVIVTFLSILEMSKNGEIILKQENNFENIYLELAGN